MAQPNPNPLADQLRSELGSSTHWTSPSGLNSTLWTFQGFELICPQQLSRKSGINRLWAERWNHRATPVILIAPSDAGPNRVNVLGPDEDHRHIRELPTQQIVDLLRSIRSCDETEAHERLTTALSAIADSITPGLRANGLLTTHFIRNRLRLPENSASLQNAVSTLSAGHFTAAWRDLMLQLGYEIEDHSNGNYLLRHQNSPIAVIQPHASVDDLNRMNDTGQLPEGILLEACQRAGAPWGILAADGRYRLFQQYPRTGAATAQWLEIHPQILADEDRIYVGLLAPRSLNQDGLMYQWSEEARDFGDELRRGLEERITNVALPQLAQGLAEWLQRQGVNTNDREQLDEIARAALTLVFRYIFVLHLEARDHLPIREQRYRRDSATTLADDCRPENGPFDNNSVRHWHSLQKITSIMRNGDQSAQVPAYNGSLFAPDRFPGASLLEKAQISDQHLAPAIASIAFENDGEDAPGLDYAGLQVGHLGAIYEALLSYRLSVASEDLVYDGTRDIYRPKRASDKHTDVRRSDLLYQTEKGGRQAAGVYYTKHEFVQHLLKHSLIPALDDHLNEVENIAVHSASNAAQHLFNFSIIDPAMGSAHFLTAALDMIADRVELFLVNQPLPDIADMLRELREDGGASANNSKDGDLLRRLILKRCIYGVDISPMAVEIANVTLWLSSFVPGLALSYLGNNLKCGDALIGVADPNVVGSKDDPIFTGMVVRNAMQQAAELQSQLIAVSDRTPDEVKHSAQLNAQIRESTIGLRTAFDLWSAQPLGLDGGRNTLTLHAKNIIAGEHPAVEAEVAQAQAIAAKYNFFHWPLEFPTVFHAQQPGFNVVVGNPPWNKIKFEMPNFLSLHDPGIRGLPSATARDQRAAQLLERNPHLLDEIEETKLQIENQRQFFHPENGYTGQSSGDTDLYQLFCERYASIAATQGYIGVVLPRVAFVNDGSRDFRRWFFKQTKPNRIDTIQNSGRWAFNMEPRYTIALVASQIGIPPQGSVTITGPARDESEFTTLINSPGVHFQLADLAAWTPPPEGEDSTDPTWELPLLPTQSHVDVLTKMRSGPRFDQTRKPRGLPSPHALTNAPTLIPYTDLHSAQQRTMFAHPKSPDRIPVWKGSSFDQYNPHGEDPAGYGRPQEIADFLQTKRSNSRVFANVLPKQVTAEPTTLPFHQARIVFRAVTRRNDSRTVIACLAPPRTPLTDRAPFLASHLWSALDQAFIVGIFNSIPFDWQARRSVETTLNYFILNGLTLPPGDNVPRQRIGSLAARLSCVDERFADFAAEAGVLYGPILHAEQDNMRAEIDALVAHAYGLSEDELRFVFTDFTDNAVPRSYRDLVITKFEREKSA